MGRVPTRNVQYAPSLRRILDTELSSPLATQMLPLSNSRASGPLPTLMVSTRLPSLAWSLITLLLNLFATQILSPSYASATGLLPVGNVPRFDPSLALSFITLSPCWLATQMFAPSKRIALGFLPTGNSVFSVAGTCGCFVMSGCVCEKQIVKANSANTNADGIFNTLYLESAFCGIPSPVVFRLSPLAFRVIMSGFYALCFLLL